MVEIRTFERDGRVEQVQLEGLGGDNIFVVRRDGDGYEFQIAGGGAAADRGLLLKYLANLARLACE